MPYHPLAMTRMMQKKMYLNYVYHEDIIIWYLRYFLIEVEIYPTNLDFKTCFSIPRSGATFHLSFFCVEAFSRKKRPIISVNHIINCPSCYVFFLCLRMKKSWFRCCKFLTRNAVHKLYPLTIWDFLWVSNRFLIKLFAHFQQFNFRPLFISITIKSLQAL